jgi:hypothetical protein
MPVWLHRILARLGYLLALAGAVAIVAGYYRLSGGLPAWDPMMVLVLLGALVFLLMYYVGLGAASALEECLPARCPVCRKATMRAIRPAWHQGVQYHCAACGYGQEPAHTDHGLRHQKVGSRN